MTYKITVNKAGTAAIESMTIQGIKYDPDLQNEFPFGEESGKVEVVIYPVEEKAKIVMVGETWSGGKIIPLNIDSSITKVSFTVISVDGYTKKTYEILFDRTPLPGQGTGGNQKEDY